jgi:hypothetical protein
VLWLFTTGAQLVLVWWYRKQPVFYLPPGWVPYPVAWVLSFPSAPLGGSEAVPRLNPSTATLVTQTPFGRKRAESREQRAERLDLSKLSGEVTAVAADSLQAQSALAPGVQCASGSSPPEKRSLRVCYPDNQQVSTACPSTPPRRDPRPDPLRLGREPSGPDPQPALTRCQDQTRSRCLGIVRRERGLGRKQESRSSSMRRLIE